MTTPESAVRGALDGAQAALRALAADAPTLAAAERLTALCAERIDAGHKILVCGNGGSACDAMHFAEELTGRFRDERPPLAAIACTDPGHLTCTANDFGFEHVFARWVRALGRSGDVLVVLSTSGNSPNILAALEAGSALGLRTVALLGKDGGRARSLAELSIVVPGDSSERIQELHMLLLHAVVDGIERILFAR
ncbi:MAG: SIS domain-containing protein [Phycisphaerae bacterium]|nr:SIS domain-containing protein [Phycisphaerae bacterium]